MIKRILYYFIATLFIVVAAVSVIVSIFWFSVGGFSGIMIGVLLVVNAALCTVMVIRMLKKKAVRVKRMTEGKREAEGNNAN